MEYFAWKIDPNSIKSSVRSKLNKVKLNSSPFFTSRAVGKNWSFDQGFCSNFFSIKPYDTRLARHLVLACALSFSTSIFAQNLPANALPTGGQVVAGSANITQTANTLNVVQSSSRAVVNWNSFNVGANATVNFQQPDANSVTFNRVTSVSQSQIDGAVKANGTVIFSNPNGVTFGTKAQVDVGSMVATTLDQSNQDFMSGKTTFTAANGANAQGAVVNQGKIKAGNVNGYVALLAPEVRNEGYIIAKGGTGNNAVALASGSQITLNFSGNSLVGVNVDASVYKSII